MPRFRFHFRCVLLHFTTRHLSRTRKQTDADASIAPIGTAIAKFQMQPIDTYATLAYKYKYIYYICMYIFRLPTCAVLSTCLTCAQWFCNRSVGHVHMPLVSLSLSLDFFLFIFHPFHAIVVRNGNGGRGGAAITSSRVESRRLFVIRMLCTYSPYTQAAERKIKTYIHSTIRAAREVAMVAAAAMAATGNDYDAAHSLLRTTQKSHRTIEAFVPHSVLHTHTLWFMVRNAM